MTVPEESRQTATAMKQEQKQKTASEMGPQIGVTIIFRVKLSKRFLVLFRLRDGGCESCLECE